MQLVVSGSKLLLLPVAGYFDAEFVFNPFLIHIFVGQNVLCACPQLQINLGIVF